MALFRPVFLNDESAVRGPAQRLSVSRQIFRELAQGSYARRPRSSPAESDLRLKSRWIGTPTAAHGFGYQSPCSGRDQKRLSRIHSSTKWHYRSSSEHGESDLSASIQLIAAACRRRHRSAQSQITRWSGRISEWWRALEGAPYESGDCVDLFSPSYPA
jgi:hypothetical protein